ncbi:MAG: hypothetical protein II436_06420 [Oscillospiraceae bacterium]|nr:hypothetical protein [Oscillospiraceae bacterium]MBQ2144734.1 hypothetical protein [Oscillospiraceae bacterium]
MRKVLSFLLLTSLLLFAGCTGTNNAGETASLPQTAAASTESESGPEPIPFSTEAETEAPTESETAAPTASVTDDPTEEETETVTEPEITRGIVEDNVYTNAFLGLRFTLPERQSFLSEKEIAQTNGISTVPLTDEMLRETLKNVPVVIDMQTRPTAGNYPFVNISYQDLDTFRPVANAKEYFEQSRESTLALFKSYGFENTSFEVETCELAGRTCDCAVIQASYGSSEIYEKMIGIASGHYLVMITLNGSDEASAETLLDGFSWIEE